MRVVFSAEAHIDVILINRESVRLFGVRQARKYQDGLREALKLIQAFPDASPERDYEDQRARVRPYGSQVILYDVGDDLIRILRIRHGLEDWHDE